jgi:hypothetical protein
MSARLPIRAIARGSHQLKPTWPTAVAGLLLVASLSPRRRGTMDLSGGGLCASGPINDIECVWRCSDVALRVVCRGRGARQGVAWSFSLGYDRENHLLGVGARSRLGSW